MRTKSILALGACLVVCAAHAQAAISAVGSRTFATGDNFWIGFDGSNLFVSGGYLGGQSFHIGSQAFQADDYGDSPANVVVESSGWYTYSTFDGAISSDHVIDSSEDFSSYLGPYTESFAGRYFGIRINTDSFNGANDGGLLYGWMKLDYNSSTGAGELLGAAINTTLNQGITAGEGMIGSPSAVPEASSHLALLALGSVGLLTRRRLKRAA